MRPARRAAPMPVADGGSLSGNPEYVLPSKTPIPTRQRGAEPTGPGRRCEPPDMRWVSVEIGLESSSFGVGATPVRGNFVRNSLTTRFYTGQLGLAGRPPLSHPEVVTGGLQLP